MGQSSGTTFIGSDTADLVVPNRSAMFDGAGALALGNLTNIWFLFYQALVNQQSSTASSALRKYWQALTPSSATYVVAHNFNTTEIVVQVYNSSGGIRQIIDPTLVISILDANRVFVSFPTAFTGFAIVIG